MVDLATGTVVDKAFLYDGNYGFTWVSPGEGIFVPWGRKRRDTVAKRGYTYARATYVRRRATKVGKNDWWVRRLTTPTEDNWGVEIVPLGK